jgi:cell division protein FtsQ
MAAQINVTTQNNFEILPAIGNQIIELGNAENLEDKFNRLYSFYKQVWAKGYYDKYAVLKAQYSGQIVAVRKNNHSPETTTNRLQATINNNIFNQYTTNN